MVEGPGAVPFSRLYELSDLNREKLDLFLRTWQTLPADERRRLVHALVELAEASFQVNFDAIFRRCLHDPDAEVRATAIDGLWEDENVSLVGPLLTALRADPSPDVRAAAAQALGRFVLAGELEEIEEPVQVRILNDLLTTIHLVGESIDVRRRALESAAYAAPPEVMDALEVAYYDDDERMRLSAVVGMGRTCDPRWRDLVLKALESPVPAMRYEAALAAGELGLRAAVPRLIALGDDADRQVYSASIWALGQIGGPEAKQALLNAYAEAPDDDARAMVEEALAEHALLEGDLDFVLYSLSMEEDIAWLTDEDEDEEGGLLGFDDDEIEDEFLDDDPDEDGWDL
jgi:HEAT repeat protein